MEVERLHHPEELAADKDEKKSFQTCFRINKCDCEVIEDDAFDQPLDTQADHASWPLYEGDSDNGIDHEHPQPFVYLGPLLVFARFRHESKRCNNDDEKQIESDEPEHGNPRTQ